MAIGYPIYSTIITGTDGIMDALEEVAASEAAESAARNFSVENGRSRAYVETVKNKALVNVVLYSVEPDRERSSIHQQLDRVTYHVNMYVKGNDDSLTPADAAATNRLHLLANQVRYALTQLKNRDFGLTVGQVDTRASSISIQFYPHEDENSASVYAPARAVMTVYFPYDLADTATKTAIASVKATSVSADDLEIWAMRYIISDDTIEE
jgi:hypothetical protein